MVPSDNDDRQVSISAFRLRPNMFHELETSGRALIVSPQIVQEAGPGPAVVHAVLASHDDGQGAEMTHKQIATESGTNVSMARRSIEKLIELGHLKATQTRGGQNNYQFPSGSVMNPGESSGLRSAHIEQGSRFPYMDKRIQVDDGQEISSSSDLSISSFLKGKPPATPLTLADEDSWTPSPIRWPEPGTPMPILAKQKIGKKGPGRTRIEAKWAVTLLEGYVLPLSNQERQQKGWKLQEAIPEHRKLRWLADAEILLADRTLADVAQMITWVFEKCSGVLPFDVVDRRGYRRKDTERKVTSFRSLAENWGPLWAAWEIGKTNHLRIIDTPITDEQEHSVDQLIEAWEDFWVTSFARGQEVHPAKRGSWAKQFRQLLGVHHLDPAELLDVIKGLKRYRSEMEHQRYFEPRYLHRDTIEWDLVLHRLKVCQAREKFELEQQPVLRKTTTTARANEDDEDRAATPVPLKRLAETEDSWDNEPWDVRRKQIIAAGAQRAAGAPNSAERTQILHPTAPGQPGGAQRFE